MKILWFWARSMLVMSVLTGVAAGLLRYALTPALEAEASLRSGGIHNLRGGPTTLVALVWLAGGYIAGVVAERHLGVAGLLAMLVTTCGALVAFMADSVTFRLATGTFAGDQIMVCALGVLCWIFGAARRTWMG